MSRLVDWLQGFALALGGPGLFLIAFFDSSFLSFPEVVDVLVIWLTTQHKERMVYYALLSTLGSVAGCYTLYIVARKGGEAFLRRRFHERHIERTMAIFQRYGLLGVLVPSLLPPPAPFKLFVFAAGVAKVRTFDFLLAVTIGRSVRYFGEGALALWYGDEAALFLSRHAKPIGFGLALTCLIIGICWIFWQRRPTRNTLAQGRE
jgi:membrane protein YqaA with SNARE-associated domain